MPPLNLTDDELQDAAQAARIASVQAEQDADRQTNPKIKGMFDNSARETGGRARLRWVTRDCALDIVPLQVSAAAEIDFGAMVTELAAAGHSRTDRKYLVWFDSDRRNTGSCGLGTIWGDDQPGAANANNNQTGYSRIDFICWDFAEAHVLLGIRATDAGDLQKALVHLRQAVRVLPRRSYIWNALAYAEQKAGDRFAAIGSARQAIRTATTAEQVRMAETLIEATQPVQR